MILQHMVGVHKLNCHLIPYVALWVDLRTATRFKPFQLVYGMEAIILIEYEILSLKLVGLLGPDLG